MNKQEKLELDQGKAHQCIANIQAYKKLRDACTELPKESERLYKTQMTWEKRLMAFYIKGAATKDQVIGVLSFDTLEAVSADLIKKIKS